MGKMSRTSLTTIWRLQRSAKSKRARECASFLTVQESHELYFGSMPRCARRVDWDSPSNSPGKE
jgi:hypothetical protein